MLVCNLLGLGFIGMGVGLAVLTASITGLHSEGIWTMVLGLVVLVGDLAFRLFHRDGHWVRPDSGGRVFFFPAWMIGVVWAVVGGVYLCRGDTSVDQSSVPAVPHSLARDRSVMQKPFKS